jgi:hypothetical protein
MFEEFVIFRAPTGSRYICDPAPADTDNDTVILASAGYEQALVNEGFVTTCTEVEYDTLGDFRSWRKGEENYIVTENELFFNRFVKATELAKRLNLLSRADRVTVFQAILYNE